MFPQGYPPRVSGFLSLENDINTAFLLRNVTTPESGPVKVRPYSKRIPSTMTNSRLQDHGSYDQWFRLVAQYSRGNLTYSHDKLPAISGLAKLFSTGLLKGDTYLASFWAGDLSRGYGIARVTPMYRAPSWPWASIDRHIAYLTYKGPRSLEVARVLAITTNLLTTDDPMGQVTGASIKLSCHLLGIGATFAFEVGEFLTRFNFDIDKGRQVPALAQMPEHSGSTRVLINTTEHLMGHHDLTLLPLVRAREVPEVLHSSAVWLHGLLVK